MRINGFKQLSAFYSWVFDNQGVLDIKQSHISLYCFLFNQNNRSNWSEWFKCPFDLGMMGSCIGSKTTYYKCLDDLQKWKLIKYKKGINDYKAPQISLIQLSNSEPLTVPLSEPLTVQLSVPLTGNIIKLITNNYKLIEDKLEGWIDNELNPDAEKPEKIDVNKFIEWFNEMKFKHKGVKGQYKTLSKTDINNLKQLKKVYSLQEFEYAYRMMLNSTWVKENNTDTPAHFLRNDNFTKYLNTEESKPKQPVRDLDQEFYDNVMKQLNNNKDV